MKIFSTLKLNIELKLKIIKHMTKLYIFQVERTSYLYVIIEILYLFMIIINF